MDVSVAAHPVRIHIDHEPYQSPNPISGKALYALGDIKEHLELFKEVDGDHEDELIDRNAHHVALTQDDHFYSQRAFDIFVNTVDKAVTKRRLTFDDLVRIEFGVAPQGPNIKITIDYSNGPPANPKGSLRKGQSVRIRNGMEFDVSATDRS